MRLLRAAASMVAVLIGGTLGYDWLTEGRYGWFRCLYMTVITVSTVGYEQIIPPESRGVIVLNMLLILFGGGAILYFISAVTSLVIEGDLVHGLFRRRVERAVARQRQHVIVVGLGRMGRAAAVELWHSGAPIVAVDHDDGRIGELSAELGEPPPFVVGDALDDDALEAAGIIHAAGLVAAMPEDRDNLYLTVIARGMNPRLRIVARVDDPSAAAKLADSGADHVVVPSVLAARRLARELVDPTLVAFLDRAFGPRVRNVAIELLEVAPTEGLGRLADRYAERRVLGLREPESDLYRFCPSPEHRLVPGQRLIVLPGQAGGDRLPQTVPRTGRVVIAGGGRVGRNVALDLLASGFQDLVVVDADISVAESGGPAPSSSPARPGLRWVHGSALDDDTLRGAGLPGAAALVAALPSARDNAYLCVAARRLEPRIRVVARVDLEGEAERLQRVGADGVASVALIGARRLRDAMVEPELAHLDAIVSDAEAGSLSAPAQQRPDGVVGSGELMLRELMVNASSRVAGRTLVDAAHHLATLSSAVLVAARPSPKKPWLWRPQGSLKLRPGVRLLALGRPTELTRLDDWFV